MESFPLIILPDADDPEAAEVLVDGEIGTATYRFLLDTGAACTCITCDDYTSTFKKAGFRKTAGAFSKTSRDLVVVPSITIGPFSKQNFLVSRRNSGENGHRNLVGMNFLKNLVMSFYFDSNRVAAGYIQKPDTGCTLKRLTLGRSAHPYLNVDFERSCTKAIWDTGSGMTVVDAKFVNDNPAYFRPSGYSTGTDSSGRSKRTPALVMEGAVIGGRHFDGVKVAAIDFSHMASSADTPFNLILGYNLIKRANWCFDFPAQKWGFLGQ